MVSTIVFHYMYYARVRAYVMCPKKPCHKSEIFPQFFPYNILHSISHRLVPFWTKKPIEIEFGPNNAELGGEYYRIRKKWYSELLKVLFINCLEYVNEVSKNKNFEKFHGANYHNASKLRYTITIFFTYREVFAWTLRVSILWRHRTDTPTWGYEN